MSKRYSWRDNSVVVRGRWESVEQSVRKDHIAQDNARPTLGNEIPLNIGIYDGTNLIAVCGDELQAGRLVAALNGEPVRV